MCNEDDYLLLSGLQHFSFCRRQWALIHIEQQWSENYLTAHGRLVHERVHDGHVRDSRNGVLTIRGLQIQSASLGLTGTCDAVEFEPAEQGIILSGRDGLWSVCPVEYKNGESKVSDCDRLQATAQAICLEEMFCCSVPQAHIFYNKTRRREKISITDELRKTVKSMAGEMHRCFASGVTPVVKPGKNCESCSLKDLCLPQLTKAQNRQSVAAYIAAAVKEVSD